MKIIQAKSNDRSRGVTATNRKPVPVLPAAAIMTQLANFSRFPRRFQ